MSMYNHDIRYASTNYHYNPVLPEVQECMDFIKNEIVKRSSYERAIRGNSRKTHNSKNQKTFQTPTNLQHTKRGKPPQTKKRGPKKKSSNLSLKKKEVAKQERVCAQNLLNLKRIARLLTNAKNDVGVAFERINHLESEMNQCKDRTLKQQQYLLSLPDSTPRPKPKPSVKPTVPPLLCIPAKPLHELKGPDHLAASFMPPNFPPELSFRALSAYSLIRSLSLPLRLSPFTPSSFLRGLLFPVPSNLISEIHLGLLRYLFASIKFGNYDARGNYSKEGSGGKKLRGGHNLNYMEGSTWTLFLEDYVELSIEKFLADDDLTFFQRSKHSSTSLKDTSRTSSGKDGGTEGASLDDDDESEKDPISDSESELEEYLENEALNMGEKSRKRRKKNESSKSSFLSARPSRGAKLEAVKKLKESPSDEEMSSHSEEASFSDNNLPKSENPVTHLKEVRESNSTFEYGAPINPQLEVKKVEDNQDLIEKSIEHERISSIPKNNFQSMSQANNNSSITSGSFTKKESNLNEFTEEKTSPEETAITTVSKKRKLGRPPRRKNRKNDDDNFQPKKKPLPAQNTEKKGPGRPAFLLSQVETISSTISTAVTYYLSKPPKFHLNPHPSPLVQAKVVILRDLPHINAIRHLRHGQCYADFSVLTKLEILEFLLDEFLVTYPISHELSHRYRMTTYFHGKYGLLPTKTELKQLMNVDECVVCGIEGDLICCDGCNASYHSKCINLPAENHLPEVWLCPECKTPNPAKLGPLYGGTKCELDWFNMQDFLSVVMSQVFSNQSNNLPDSSGTQPQINNLLLGEAENPSRPAYGTNAEVKTNEVVSAAIPEIKEAEIQNKLQSNLGADLNKLNQNGNDINTKKLPRQNLKPTILPTDNRDFMIIHGFVFTRTKKPPSAVQPYSPPIPLSQSELFDLIRSLGPQYSMKWPWCQIPFNPFEIWRDLNFTLGQSELRLLEEKRSEYIQYFNRVESYNPSSYINAYREAMLPAYLTPTAGSIKPKPSYRKEDVMRSTLVQGITRETISDSKYFQTLLSHRQHYDPSHVCKDYILRLEKSLLKSCLLNDLWGTNKKIVQSLWHKNVLRCSSVLNIAKLCVQLVDAAHSRAFYEEWNKPITQTRSKHSSSSVQRMTIVLPDDWTSEKEYTKRKWERGGLREMIRLLRKEGKHLGRLMNRRKNRNIHKWNIRDPSLPTLKTAKIAHDTRVHEEIASSLDIVAITEEIENNDKDLTDTSRKGNSEFAMTPGAIRARNRRKQEKEERERYKREMLIKLRVETAYAEKLMEFGATQQNEPIESAKVEETKVPLDEVKETTSDVPHKSSETPKKKKIRKKNSIPLGSRRRSGRHLSRPLTVDNAMNTLKSSGISDTSKKKAKSMDSMIQTVRSSKLVILEKNLNKHMDRETHWPICGGRFFPPMGSLPRPVLKKMGRNSGMTPAPFMTYSNKFEVGQPSMSHVWRKKTITCTTIEELSLQLNILESYLNRSTIHSCEALGRRSTHAKASVPKVIHCTHVDPETGLIEYFVVNVKKRKGIWLSEENVDQSALILEKSNRIEKQQKKFSSKMFEKLNMEKEKIAKEENLRNEKRIAKATLQNIQSHSSMIQNSVFAAKNDVNMKQENTNRLENEFANVQRQSNKDKDRLTLLQKDLNDVLETQRKVEGAIQGKGRNQYGNSTSDAQLEQAFMEYIDKDIRDLNSLEFNQSRDMIGGRNYSLSGGHRLTKGRGNTLEPLSNFYEMNSQDVLRWERAFLDAVNGHRTATTDLLQESAELGLDAVPIKRMQEARFASMAKMKEANNKLRVFNSPKCVSDTDLTNALVTAEEEGMSIYVKQLEAKKQKSLDQSASYEKSVHNYYDGNRSLKGRNESLHYSDSQALDRQFAQQQKLQQMNQQSMLSTSQTAFTESNHNDYSSMNNPISKSDLNMLIQQPRRQYELQNNSGQNLGSDLANRFVLENQSQRIHDPVQHGDLYPTQLNNQLLMQANQLGDNLMNGIRQPYQQNQAQNLSSFGNAASNIQDFQTQQNTGQFTSNYANQAMTGYDYGSSPTFNTQFQQQRNSQSLRHNTQQQLNQISTSQPGNIHHTGHSHFQNSSNTMDYNQW